ncbi:MAG TPA: hypothetical protein VFG04_27255 [Planctomycetaceae bacterium]|jgi:hypothetical protein|nr:hypothetical protein [Planctomycetaceae bacterium]
MIRYDKIPVRRFFLCGLTLLTAAGVAMELAGYSVGSFVAGFFGLGLVLALVEPLFMKLAFWLPLPQPRVSCDYRLSMTDDEVACEHPKRIREAIRWEDVNRIWYVTTSDGPWLPDAWFVLEGEQGGCSFPTEATDINNFWDQLKQRFPGFDYQPIIRGGTDDARYLCWERGAPATD